jgi:hypothetical protein
VGCASSLASCVVEWSVGGIGCGRRTCRTCVTWACRLGGLSWLHLLVWCAHWTGGLCPLSFSNLHFGRISLALWTARRLRFFQSETARRASSMTSVFNLIHLRISQPPSLRITVSLALSVSSDPMRCLIRDIKRIYYFSTALSYSTLLKTSYYILLLSLTSIKYEANFSL